MISARQTKTQVILRNNPDELQLLFLCWYGLITCFFGTFHVTLALMAGDPNMEPIKYISKAQNQQLFLFQCRTCRLYNATNLLSSFSWKAIKFFISQRNKGDQNCWNFFHNCFGNLVRVGLEGFYCCKCKNRVEPSANNQEASGEQFSEQPHEDNWEKLLNSDGIVYVLLRCRREGWWERNDGLPGQREQRPGWNLAVLGSGALTSTNFTSSDHQ